MYGTRTRCENCLVCKQGACAALDTGARAQLSYMSRRKILPPHTPIFHDGDYVDQYFNVVSGVVKLTKTLADGHQHIIGLKYPPDFMGQMLNQHYSYSSETATDVELCVYPRGPFESFLKQHPELERQIFDMLVHELDVCRDWMILLGRKGAYRRVAGFLLMLARRIPQDGHIQFELPLTRAEIADCLGLTVETVSRQFSRLKKKQVIDLPSRHDIAVPDIELLSTVAQLEGCPDTLDEVKAASLLDRRER